MTVIVKNVVPDGNGGGGMMLQSTVGIDSTGVDVLFEKIVATPNVHSYWMMLLGAVDVLPLNVQFSVVLFAISHVSVSEGPVTPNDAVAALGCTTLIVALADDPP